MLSKLGQQMELFSQRYTSRFILIPCLYSSEFKLTIFVVIRLQKKTFHSGILPPKRVVFHFFHSFILDHTVPIRIFGLHDYKQLNRPPISDNNVPYFYTSSGLFLSLLRDESIMTP